MTSLPIDALEDEEVMHLGNDRLGTDLRALKGAAVSHFSTSGRRGFRRPGQDSVMVRAAQMR